MTVHPQYIVDENENRTAVVLPLKEWNAIVELLEEFADIRAYDTAKAASQDRVPFEEAMKEIATAEGE